MVAPGVVLVRVHRGEAGEIAEVHGNCSCGRFSSGSDRQDHHGEHALCEPSAVKIAREISTSIPVRHIRLFRCLGRSASLREEPRQMLSGSWRSSSVAESESR